MCSNFAIMSLLKKACKGQFVDALPLLFLILFLRLLLLKIKMLCICLYPKSKLDMLGTYARRSQIKHFCPKTCELDGRVDSVV